MGTANQASITRSHFNSVGRAVAIDDIYAIIGAGNNAGEAHIFQRAGSQWQLVSDLKASDARIGDFFGSAVGIDNGRIIIGATGSGSVENGGVYFFFQE